MAEILEFRRPKRPLAVSLVLDGELADWYREQARAAGTDPLSFLHGVVDAYQRLVEELAEEAAAPATPPRKAPTA